MSRRIIRCEDFYGWSLGFPEHPDSTLYSATMKLTSQLFVAGLAPFAHAFPAVIYEAAVADPALEARAKELAKMLEAR